MTVEVKQSDVYAVVGQWLVSGGGGDGGGGGGWQIEQNENVHRYVGCFLRVVVGQSDDKSESESKVGQSDDDDGQRGMKRTQIHRRCRSLLAGCSC